MLSGTLKSLFAVSEAYPELKANANFQQLQSQLADTEDKISYMRQSFNDTVMKYNTAIQTFPAVLFAGMFGFKERSSFDAQAGAEVAPKVTFGSRRIIRQKSVRFCGRFFHAQTRSKPVKCSQRLTGFAILASRASRFQ